MKTKIINCFGGPGVAKSTICAGVFYELKRQHYNIELINEYARDIVFENRAELLSDQLYILAKQHRKILRLNNKVDYVLTDSPLLQNLGYTPNGYFNSYTNLVKEVFTAYDNINFYIKRNTEYNNNGRYQNLEEAINLDNNILKLLKDNNVPYFVIDNIDNAVNDIINKIKNV